MPEATEKEIELARRLVVTYYIGYKASTRTVAIPQTASELNKHGHDGLNWQAFLPLAKDILKQDEEDEPRRPDQEGTSPPSTL